MPNQTVFCEWGLNGIKALQDTATVFVIVDVLSFSTAVDVAVSRGAVVHPFPLGDRPAAQKAAGKVGAVLAQPRKAADGQFSLSPKSLMQATPGLKLMLPSPNGSRLTLEVEGRPVLAGCLRNANAVAAAAMALAQGGDIAVIPAGERWPDGTLRPAIEDWLGAGAIVDALALPCSAEARLARSSWQATASDFASIVSESISGRELIEAGFAEDVELALTLNASLTAPLLSKGAYGAFAL